MRGNHCAVTVGGMASRADRLRWSTQIGWQSIRHGVLSLAWNQGRAGAPSMRLGRSHKLSAWGLMVEFGESD